MGRNKGNKMKGISQEKANKNSIKYRRMYEQWSTHSTTLEQMGKEHNLTKQRIWQIITRCKLGDGEYYYGTQIARNKWSEFKTMYDDLDQTKRAFDDWLKERDVKLISNNQKTAPHTGWDWSV
jgi:mannitol-specific phosphotransferase system IIBC component